MNNTIFISLLNNTILLLAMATVYDLVAGKSRGGGKILTQILTGIALGFIGIGLVLASVRFYPGIIFDTRSVLLSVSGLFFGLIPTVIAMIMISFFRLLQGGTAMYAGIAVIIATGSLGLLWRHLRRKPLEQITSGELFVFGIITHVIMLTLMFLIPLETALNVLAQISLPVLTIYPLGTVALGLLLAGRLRRQHTAIALAESEKTYRRLFHNKHTVMLLVDPENGVVVDANPAACQFYGWSHDEFCRMKISQINTLPLEKIREKLKTVQDSECHEFFLQHRLADGSLRDVEVLSSLITIGEQELLYSIIHDVTERNRFDAERTKLLAEAEQARHALLNVIEDQKLAETRLQRLSTAIEQSPEAVVITGPDGIIQYVNPAFETTTGWSREEAVGKNSSILKSGQHDAVFYSSLWKTISSGTVWTGRLINKRKNGELYTEEASISPVRDTLGAINGYVAVKRDITEELAQEEKFRQSQKMEAVGQLAGGIAHDFNNILQAILGFSEILLNRLNRESMEHRNAAEIQKAANRAAELTRQLLAFSRKQPVERKRIDLNAELRDEEVLLQILLGSKIPYYFEMAEDLHPIYADHSQITQIIMNLAVNARDAMPNGGRLTFATKNITFEPQAVTTIPEAEPGSFVCLSVTDTGCGMNREVRDHLFEPFFTTKAVGQGTGLGLAVVYGIVKQNKGWIHVYSEEGLGSTFKIYLPAFENDAPDAPENRLHNGRILLVEDDADTRNLVVRILSMSGYEPVTASNAEEAIQLFVQENGRFDLLFSDMILPGKTGLELADALRAKTPDLPVLLYSGYQDQRERWITLESKGYCFLQKPFSVTGLLSAVHDTLTETIR